MIKDSSNWRIVLLPEDGTDHGADPIFDATYAAWHRTWAPVYESVGEGRLASDAFTRQTDRLAIYRGDECAAVTLFHRTDLTRDLYKNDSYFHCWPELAIRGLCRKGPLVNVCSFFTVIPEFRRGIDFSVKDLLMGALVRYHLDSSYHSMTGNMRNSKGMHELAYRWGATPLMKNVEAHGELNDLVGFFHETCKRDGIPELKPFLDELWERREIVGTPLERRRAKIA